MRQNDLDELRGRVNELNIKVLDLINERTTVVQEIGKVKEKQGVNRYDPIREREMLNFLKESNNGPIPNGVLEQIFKGIFMSALEIQEDDQRNALLVSRKAKPKIQLSILMAIKLGTEHRHSFTVHVQLNRMSKF